MMLALPMYFSVVLLIFPAAPERHEDSAQEDVNPAVLSVNALPTRRLK